MTRKKGHRSKRMFGFYIAGICALSGVVGLTRPAFAASPSHGAEVFQRFCAGCHGEGGEGAMPGMPNFTRGEGMMQPDRVLADSIRFGKTVMPAFQGLLRDEEIYDVIAYLRTLQ